MSETYIFINRPNCVKEGMDRQDEITRRVTDNTDPASAD
jgi:hypothetical protein